MASSLKTARFLIDSKLRDAARGDANACFDLGMVFSAGAEGADVDLVAAHKWFNIAAAQGDRMAARHREEVASEMSREDIAAALKAAREYLSRH